MRPNFETGNVEMNEDEFTRLLSNVHWLGTGRAVQTLHDLKRAHTDFILGAVNRCSDDLLPIGVMDDLQTWTLGKEVVDFALDKLALIGNHTSVQLAYDKLIDKARGHAPETHNERESRRLAWEQYDSCTWTYTNLLDSTMKLEEHQRQQ